MQKNDAQRAALDILKKYDLQKATLDNIVYIAAQLGFETIDFDRTTREFAKGDFADNEALAQLAMANDAFLVVDNYGKRIYVYERLVENDKLYALAHELGHIVCNHTRYGTLGKSTFAEEREANDFAYALLNPPVQIRIRGWLVEHKAASVIIIIAMCLAICAPFVYRFVEQKMYHDDYYVTDGGEKYHKVNCFYIQGHETHRLTEEDFYSGKYEPCKICIR